MRETKTEPRILQIILSTATPKKLYHLNERSKNREESSSAVKDEGVEGEKTHTIEPGIRLVKQAYTIF